MLLELLILVGILTVVFFELYPVKVLKVENCKLKGKFTKTNQKSFVVHVHTYFSYDSLGKPEEIEKVAQTLGVDKVFITDHDRKDLKGFFPPSDRLVFGWEYKDEVYGRLLKLAEGKYTVIAHPNNEKKAVYRFKNRYENHFFYELVNLKDVLQSSKFPLTLYFFFRSVVLYPLLGLKALDYFPKLIPLKSWIGLYLKRTRGKLKIIGGLDHHVKISFWEKPKKFFSIPHYSWSFYILKNKTFGEDIFTSLNDGSFYLSFCSSEIYVAGNRVLANRKRYLTFNHFGDGKVSVNSCGKIEKGAKVVAIYVYTFRVGKLFFGLTPLAVFRWDETSAKGG
ncbi:MAG TPA: hypothetical protein EYH37_01765 [Aquifex aeolicus]|uniref:Uncharacterized protein n=1 Tax=Aquifex aeolicus TaxID=63363 RepID=A0A9D1CF65_AQUAO|nr:hypothetical protein [Aquifex aeolicus]